jgi:hypothetical protein
MSGRRQFLGKSIWKRFDVTFYFAWCGPGETFNAGHLREDEFILSFDIGHLEGQIPTLDIEVKNPHVGLLAPGRLQWAWFSYQSPYDNSITPLFYGRLIALPSNLLNEVVTLKFISRPPNFIAQKQAVAERMKVSPYYDPIWIKDTMLDDADTILESYSMAWHVDRFAQSVTVSDITSGEDGTEEFQQEDAFYDSVSISFAQNTQNQVLFDGTINWTQEEVGLIPLPPVSIAALNSSQIASDFPQPGQTLADGVTVASSNVTTGTGGSVAQFQGWNTSLSFKSYEKEHRNGDVISSTFSQQGFPGVAVSLTGGGTSGDEQHGIAAEHHYHATYAGVKDAPSGAPNVQADMTVRYEMARGRTETLKLILVSGIQSIITTPDDAPFNPIKISMQGSDVNLPLAGQPPPLGYSGRSTFFPTDRGIQSMLYPMLVARAHLMQAARAVKISFNCTFERVLSLNCRKNALLHDPRLPGGQVIGKITEYHIKGSGDSGDLVGVVMLESTIGTGDQIIVSEGNPTYVADGYVAIGWQHYENADMSLPTSDLTMEMPASLLVDDGLVTPLDKSQIVTKFVIHPGVGLDEVLIDTPTFPPPPSDLSIPSDLAAPQSVQTQYNNVINATTAVNQAIQAAIVNDPTWIEIQVQPVSNQAFHAEYDLGVGYLTIPKLINLEAASG